MTYQNKFFKVTFKSKDGVKNTQLYMGNTPLEVI